MGSERSMAVNPAERIRILPLVRNTQRFGPRRPKVASLLRKVCGLTDTTSLPGLHRSKPRWLTRRGKPGAPRGRASALTDPNLRGLKHSQGGWAGGRRPTRPQRSPQPPGRRGETSAVKHGARRDPTAQPGAARGDRPGVSPRPGRASPSPGRRGGRRRRRGQRRDLPWARELLKVPPPPPAAQRRRGAAAAWPGSAAASAAAAGGSSSCGRRRGAEQVRRGGRGDSGAAPGPGGARRPGGAVPLAEPGPGLCRDSGAGSAARNRGSRRAPRPASGSSRAGFGGKGPPHTHSVTP